MKFYLNTGFRNELDKQEQHEMAYTMLHRLLKECDVPEKAVIVKTDQGKPYLRDYPFLHFNISHCSKGVAAAVSSRAVGVDIEGRIVWKEKLARKISSPKEWKYLQSAQTDEEKAARLSILWSRKEAYLKCTGEGIRTNLSQVNVLLDKKGCVETENATYRFREFQNDSYTICICEKL